MSASDNDPSTLVRAYGKSKRLEQLAFDIGPGLVIIIGGVVVFFIPHLILAAIIATALGFGGEAWVPLKISKSWWSQWQSLREEYKYSGDKMDAECLALYRSMRAKLIAAVLLTILLLVAVAVVCYFFWPVIVAAVATHAFISMTVLAVGAAVMLAKPLIKLISAKLEKMQTARALAFIEGRIERQGPHRDHFSFGLRAIMAAQLRDWWARLHQSLQSQKTFTYTILPAASGGGDLLRPDPSLPPCTPPGFSWVPGIPQGDGGAIGNTPCVHSKPGEDLQPAGAVGEEAHGTKLGNGSKTNVAQHRKSQYDQYDGMQCSVT